MWKESNKIWKEHIKIVSLGKVFKACLLSKTLKAEPGIIMVSKEQQKQCSVS